MVSSSITLTRWHTLILLHNPNQWTGSSSPPSTLMVNIIHIHKLREGDDLKAAIKSYQSTHARAVIIINNEDSQTLSEESSALLECFDNYLIIVLSSEEGSSLFKILDDDHEIHAKYGV